MKKVKRVLTLVLVILMMTAVLVACSGKQDTTEAEDTAAETSAADTEAADTSEEEETNAAGNEAVGAASIGEGKDIFNEEIKIAWIPLSTAGQVNEVINLCFEDCLRIYPNVTITTFDPQYDVNKQISILNDCITQEYDAVFFLAMDTAACNNVITEAEEAGIPVITIDCGATAVHTFHLQGTDYGSGQMAAEIVAEELGGVGNYIVLDAPAEQKAIGRMGTGFIDYMEANTDCVMLEDYCVPMWSQENANTGMRDLLTLYDDIQAVYCASDDIAMGALQAIEAAGRDDEGIIIYGNVGYAPVLEAIKDGRIYGTNYSDTYSHFYTVFHMTMYFIQTGQTGVLAGYESTPYVYDTLVPVNADNVDYIMDICRYYK